MVWKSRKKCGNFCDWKCLWRKPENVRVKQTLLPNGIRVGHRRLHESFQADGCQPPQCCRCAEVRSRRRPGNAKAKDILDGDTPIAAVTKAYEEQVRPPKDPEQKWLSNDTW